MLAEVYAQVRQSESAFDAMKKAITAAETEGIAGLVDRLKGRLKAFKSSQGHDGDE